MQKNRGEKGERELLLETFHPKCFLTENDPSPPKYPKKLCFYSMFIPSPPTQAFFSPPFSLLEAGEGITKPQTENLLGENCLFPRQKTATRKKQNKTDFCPKLHTRKPLAFFNQVWEKYASS